MNKIDFLRKLDRALQGLNQEERKEILDFYEERFYSGTFYENKTEQEVISELESPAIIAHNVLAEYGLTSKFSSKVQFKEKGISGLQVTLLVFFDLIVTSWLIVTLASVTFSLFATVLTYFATFSLLFGDYGSSGTALFIFFSGVYIFIFLFALFLLDLTVAVTKTIFMWHLNVFKYKNRAKVAKSFNKNSVDGWFKKHRKFNSLRRVMFILALVLTIYSGYELFYGDDSIIDEYQNRTVETAIYNHDVEQDIIDLATWELTTDFDAMDIEIVTIPGNTINIIHNYYDENDFKVTFNDDTNTINITNDVNNVLFNLDLLALFFEDDDGLIIEIPSDLLLAEIYIENANGAVNIINVNTEELKVYNINGSITLNSIDVIEKMSIATKNGNISIKNITGEVELETSTSNGSISINNVEFTIIESSSSNGNINLDNIGLAGNTTVVIAQTTNGNIDVNDAYSTDMFLDTTNGDIDLFNTDIAFVINLETHTTLGTVTTNID